jgi:multidrug efflux pump subunit AcrB
MGAAFMVAILGIYILVVAQFKSLPLPLVILTPIPLT